MVPATPDELNRQVRESLKRLGPALETLRREAGLRQREVAARAGMSLARISRYERGHEVPNLNTLFKCLTAMDADLRDLAVVMRHLGRRFDDDMEQMLELASVLRNILTTEVRDAVSDELSGIGVTD